MFCAYDQGKAGRKAGREKSGDAHVLYYEQGRLSALNLNGVPWITTIQYQPFRPVSGWTWADGSAYQNTYDLDGRLAQHPIGPEQRQLQYDPAGNIIQQNDRLPDGQSLSRSYQYDLLGRLIDAQGDLLQQSWDYDANGNRLSQYDGALVTNYAVDPEINRLLQIADKRMDDKLDVYVDPMLFSSRRLETDVHAR